MGTSAVAVIVIKERHIVLIAAAGSVLGWWLR